MSTRSNNSFRTSKHPVTGLLLLALLVLQTLASSVDLHRALHDDAAHVEHECAVTLVSSGQIDLVETRSAIPEAPTLSFELPRHCDSVSLQTLLYVNSTRGPPSLA